MPEWLWPWRRLWRRRRYYSNMADDYHSSAGSAAEDGEPDAMDDSCSSLAAAAAAPAALSEEALRRLAELVAGELRKRGIAGDGGGGSDGGELYRSLAEGASKGSGDGGGIGFGDALASYLSLLLALLALAGAARFALEEYRLAMRKYRSDDDDDDDDGDDDGGGGDGDNDNNDGGKEEGEGGAAPRNKRQHRRHSVRFTWSELFWYRLDHHLSTSKWATTALLLSATFALVAAGALLMDLCTGRGLAGSAWLAWTYVADPGTHADAEGGAAVAAVSLLVTVGGMLVFAMVVGIVSDALGEKVHDLKKGGSRVIESDHTLMLGWTDKSLAIIQEVANANESEGGGTVVVLAERDKEEMEETLDAAVGARDHPLRLMGTEVVFRSGNPLMETELDKVSASTARSIIALSPDGCDPDEADSRMVRQVLSLKQFERLKGHVVVEMQDVDNKDLILLVASDIAEVIVAHDMIGRLMIQCAREPGLAYVLENLMGFDGAEFYLERWPRLYGRTFLEITCRFDDAVPIGIKGLDGHISLNPENGRVYREGEEILCLAEDNDTYEPNDGSYPLECGRIPSGLRPQPEAERLLFCGWRRDMADMIMQLDEYVSKGSELWLFNEVPVSERLELLRDKGNKEELRTRNLRIINAQGNPIVRRDLKLLKALRYDGEPNGHTVTLDEFDSVLILADSAATEKEEGSLSSDSRSLASLLIIQDVQQKMWQLSQQSSLNHGGGGEGEGGAAAAAIPRVTMDGGHKKGDNGGAVVAAAGGGGAPGKGGAPQPQWRRPQDGGRGIYRRKSSRWANKPPTAPISEILDTRTRSLLNVAKCQGYIMSNEIVSGAIAVVSEDRDMNAVLGEVLSAEGNETYIRDAALYIDLSSEQDRRKSFWDVALRARQRREVALGYKPAGMSFADASEILLNPDGKMEPRVWAEGDVVIVFAFE